MTRCLTSPLRTSVVLALTLGGAFGRVSLGQTSPDPEKVPRIAQSSQIPKAQIPPTPTPTPTPPAPEREEAAFIPGTTSGMFGPTEAALPVNRRNAGAAGGYIDSAIPLSLVRVRYDAANRNNRPDRAEFFYPQFGPTRDAGQPVNFQDQSTYVEYAPLPNMSAFIDVPTRFIHIPGAIGRVDLPHHLRGTYFQPRQNFSGFSDLQLGVKYAFIANPDYFYTFQLRTYLPTGTGRFGLGTTHASLEPGFLAFQRLSERLFFIGEFKDWIPLHGSIFKPNGRHYAGNILNYGVGLFYNLVLTDRFRVAPTAEFLGWTVLGGLKETAPNIVQSAVGDTIVNFNFGVRFALGNYINPGGPSPLNDRLSLHVSYSRSLTGDWWYKNMFRLELNWYY
jgi:hypothetical protein